MLCVEVAHSNTQLVDWLCRQTQSDMQVLHTAAGTLLEQVVALADVMQPPS